MSPARSPGPRSPDCRSSSLPSALSPTVPATDARHRIQKITLPGRRRSFTAEKVSGGHERAQITGFAQAHARLKSAVNKDWYDGGPDSCRIAESEVVWRATALEGLRSFRLSVLTACARR